MRDARPWRRTSPATPTPWSTASRACWWTTSKQLPVALGRVLGDEVLRSRLSKGALARARWFTWDATARRALEALAGEVTSLR